MKKYFYISALLISVAFYSCEKIDNSGLVFKNTFEEMGRWASTYPTLTLGKAHSGKYYSKLDSVNIYSITFQDSLAGISNKVLKKATVSAWVFYSDPNANGELIFTIWDKNEKPLFTKSEYVQLQVKNVNEWTEVKLEVTIPENLVPQDMFKIYALQHGKSDILIDDFQVSFEN